MSAWDWIFGLVGICGLIFSVYIYYRSEIAKVVETANNRIRQDRIQNLHMYLIGALHNADTIVQTSKMDSVTPQELGNMARVLRGQLYAMAKVSESENKKLNKWRFGHMIETQGEVQQHLEEHEAADVDVDTQ
jgi:hypothetical protein